MQESIIKKLLDLNRQFYQTFATQFSGTRMRLQPGVRHILEGLPAEARILDLGCGNGELARALSRRGQQGAYTGLDFSSQMLEIARQKANGEASLQLLFLQADLADPGWDAPLKSASYTPFDLILAFAVLHHLPGAELRTRVLQKAHDLLVPDGLFIHSEWQFLNSPRLRARIQPWEKIGLTEAGVDPGDYLLDWRQGGFGLRYVHQFSQPELANLAAETGFEVRETFTSDGEGGNLGLYQVWGRA